MNGKVLKQVDQSEISNKAPSNEEIAKGRGKRAQRAKAFAKVRDEAVQLLARLSMASPSYKKLKDALAAADLKADSGTFKQAAADMQQVVADLRAAIASFDPTPKLEKIKGFIDSATKRADSAVKALRDIAAFRDLEADALSVGCVVSPHSAPPRGNLDAAKWAANMRTFIKTYNDHLQDCRNALNAIDKDLSNVLTISTFAVSQSKNMDQEIKAIAIGCTQPPHAKTLDGLRMRWHNEVTINARYADLKDPTNRTKFARFDALTAPVQAKQASLRQAMRGLEVQLRIWEAQARQAEAEVRSGTSGLRPQAFKDLAATQEEMTLGAAKEKGLSTKPRRTDGLPEFDTAGFFTSGALPPYVTAKPGQAGALKNAAAAELHKFIEAQKIAPDSDEMFDLSLRSTAELAREYALGQGWDAAKMTDDQKAAAQSVGEGMFEAMRALIPDKLVTKGTAQLVLGGKIYEDPELLGEGGLGRAMRYTDRTDGATIVVKTLKVQNEEKRAEMVREIKAQRYLMSGDDQAVGRDNVVGLEGAVTDEDGNLHMVMEVVDGGDLDDNRMGMMLAVRGNALPEEARNVLQQAATKQTIEGLIYLRDQNVVHFDVKGANILLDAEGNAKVADFGSADVGTAAGGQRTMGLYAFVTPGYAAPEGGRGRTVDERFDMHALGKVIQVMHTNAMGPADANTRNLTGALKRLTEAMSAEHPDDRPTLEAVLESSYLKNLQAYDSKDVKALAAKSVAYTKALRAEMKDVRKKVPPSILRVAQEAGNASKPENVSFASLTTLCSMEIQLATKAAAALVKQLEAPGVKPQEQAQLKQQIAEKRAVIKQHQDVLDSFGQSAAAKQLAAEMKEISQRLTRAQVDIQNDDGDLDALATALVGAAADPAGFYSVVTLPAYRTAFDEIGLDYPALLRLTGHYQMNLGADNPNADAQIQALEQQVAGFMAGFPKGQDALRQCIADGLEAVVADLKMRRKDPQAGRRT